MRFLPFLLIFISKCRSAPHTPQSTISVDTPRGRVVGFHASFTPNILSNHSSSGNVFLGIPFALPPTDQRRFKRPYPIFNYASNPLYATKLGPACPQFSRSPLETSEDCLFLNVITPSTRSPQLYPVMVFIHGGSFSSGSARYLDYEGLIRNLVRHGVIIVMVQYRLGALGFFNTGTEDFPGNLGLFDQIEALRWVQSDIVHFGGDPSRVTLFGNSAGAASISAHTYSPLSRGLFHSVIQQSGTILTCLDGAFGSTDPSRDFAQKVCNFTAAEWEMGNFTRLHGCFYTMDTNKLTAYDERSLTGWKMVQDPFFLPSTPQKLAPIRHNVPVLIGSMRDEFMEFIQLMEMGGVPKGADFSVVASHVIPDKAQLNALLLPISAVYMNISRNDVVDKTRATSDAITAAAFVAPMQREIREWMKSGNFDVFIYEMTQPSTVRGVNAIGDWHPAIHGGEQPYISCASDYWKKALANNWTTPYDFELIEWMGEAWTNFAKTGVPSPSWSPVSPYSHQLPYLEISSTGVRMNPDYRSNDEYFWNVKVPEIVGDLPPEKTFLFNIV